MAPIKDISLQSIPSYPPSLRPILIIKIQTDKRTQFYQNYNNFKKIKTICWCEL
jgi:hypothetical protein